MPVIYEFTTTLIMPTSAEFPCMDVQETVMPNILLFPEVTPSRGAPYFSIDVNNDLAIYSGDNTMSSLIIEMPLGTNHTFETTFKPSALPEDLTNLALRRFFIGTYDKQGNASGVLLSTKGIAVAGSFGSSAAVLPGSQNIFTEGEDYYTIRLVVDGVNDVMSFYATRTAEIPSSGHLLRYSLAAPTSPPGTIIDHIRIEILGDATKEIKGKFSSFRANCTDAIGPNQAPIADPGADQTTTLGAAVSHDGRNSYDPEGQPLTYKWSLKDCPDTSSFKYEAEGGSTSDDGDGDGFTPIFQAASNIFSMANMPQLQPGDNLLILGVLYEVSTTRWQYNGTTARWERDTLSGWVDNQVVVTDDVIPDSLTDVDWQINFTDSFFNDRTAGLTSSVADASGIYTVVLVVNDGQLNSLPAEALVSASPTTITLGCIPDVSWIWNQLSDFWNLLEDRDMVESSWSGFAQACAAQLLTAWQIDYGKSLLDIQRVFHRRWLPYDMVLDEPNYLGADIRIIRGPIYSGDIAAGIDVVGKTLQLVLDDGDVETVTFSGVNPLTPETVAAQINDQMGFRASQTKLASVVVDGAKEYLKLEYGTLLRVRPNGTANGYFTFPIDRYLQNDLGGLFGGIESQGSTKAFTTADALNPLDPPVLDFDEEGVGSADLVAWQGMGYRVVKTALDPTTDTIRALTLSEDMPDSGGAAGVPPPDRYPWVVPSIVTSTELNFTDQLVSAGDLAIFEVKKWTEDSSTTVYCEIEGVREFRLGFDPLPLLLAYAGAPSDYRTYFMGVKRTNMVPVDDLVMEIPRLQEVIKGPAIAFDQNTDFQVETIDGTRAIRFVSGTFSLGDPPPDILWAEVTYLDNRPTISDNFGRMVDFTTEDLEERTDDLDYLSAVRGLWWAYFGGPALYKVRVGTQILLGLPFAEATGVIEEIQPRFSLTQGRLIVRDEANDNVTRTYFYPRTAGLATHQDTGVELAEGDTVEQFAPLSAGIEVLDHIKTSDWLESYVSQGRFLELDKFFRFLVRGDVDTFNLANMAFAMDFVRKIKPHYTYPLFVLRKNFIETEEVDVLDQVLLTVNLSIFDSFCGTGPFMWDASDGGGSWSNAYDKAFPPPPPPFVFDTYLLCPLEDVWVAWGYTHPGSAGWFYDTIWAYDDADTDGDGNTNDRIGLSGPDHQAPPPFGPLVGKITYDWNNPTGVLPGTYWRAKTLN
jgi:hypothetical protein